MRAEPEPVGERRDRPRTGGKGRRWARAVAWGGVALVGIAGGVFANHLPWPGLLERHPGWVTFGFFALAAVSVGAGAVFWYFGRDAVADPASPPAATTERTATAGPGGTAVAGDENVVAGPGGVAVRAGGSVTVQPPVREPAAPLPPPRVDRCFGRNAEVAAVVAGWLAGRPVAVLGGPGIGKSTVLGRALGDPAVIERYGDRRFVVSCDGAESMQQVVDKMVEALGVVPGDHLWNRVVSFLREAPCVLVLDNFETVADNDHDGAAELVATLRAEPGKVVLGVGYRGGAVPVAVTGDNPVRLPPLSHDDAIDLFVAEAGEEHRADPDLEPLITELDGVPLAIVLLGALAAGQPGLATLTASWRSKHTDLLRQGSADRTSSLPVSIELSWDRLSADARAALSLAALLPDGWPHDRYDMYLPTELAAGVLELGSRALLHADEARQRCLTPIRQHVLARHAPDPDKVRGLLDGVRALTNRCAQIGRTGGDRVVTEVTPEFTNLVEVIRAGLPAAPGFTARVPDLLRFQRFTGLGDGQLADEARWSESGAWRAAITLELGVLYFARGDNERARERFDEALSLYEQVGDVLGEANCLREIGDIEFRESRILQAHELFERALSLYERVGDLLGRANCLRNLGEMKFRESRDVEARELFERALPLFRRVGSVLGEANCLCNLGRVEFEESRNVQARERFDEALPLYRQIGSVLGEADCLCTLGEVEFRESHDVEARELFERALPLFRRVGSVLGEANCLCNLGRVEFEESRNVQARERFDEALPLFRRVGSVLGEANCLCSLGEVEFRESHDVEARELFEQALGLHERIGDRRSQAGDRAWLAHMTEGEEKTVHCAEMERLIAELDLPADAKDELRSIAGS